MFSLEMGDVQLVQRMMSDLMFDGGQVPYSNLRSGNFHQDTFNRIREAGDAIAKLPITIEQQPGLTVAQISARSAPARMMSAVARAPPARVSASTMIDLPAPVSPVSTVRPGAKSSSTVSTMARSRIRRWVSMVCGAA